jgi:hypothetical protein
MEADMDRDFLVKLSRELVDKGKLIEAGWISLRLAAISPEAEAVQLNEMPMAFFAGAQHLFGSIMSIMDEDREPTDADMNRMSLISDELDTFIAEFQKKHGLKPPQAH